MPPVCLLSNVSACLLPIILCSIYFQIAVHPWEHWTLFHLFYIEMSFVLPSLFVFKLSMEFSDWQFSFQNFEVTIPFFWVFIVAISVFHFTDRFIVFIIFFVIFQFQFDVSRCGYMFIYLSSESLCFLHKFKIFI